MPRSTDRPLSTPCALLLAALPALIAGALLLVLMVLPAPVSAHAAEDGYQPWLRYPTLPAAQAEALRARCATIIPSARVLPGARLSPCAR